MNSGKLTRAGSVALVTLLATCSNDTSGPDTPTLPATPETLLFQGAVSEPVASFVDVSASGGSGGGTVYVAFAAGEQPDWQSFRLSNRMSGLTDTTRYAVVDGGSDPIGIAADVGDTLQLDVVRFDGSTVSLKAGVPSKRAPRVVRTSPGPGRVDVAVNVRILVVFSEPIDPATLTSATVQLLKGSEPVEGTFVISGGSTLSVEFEPAQPLSPATSYMLVVNRGVQDLSGDSLQTLTAVEFRTGAALSGSMVVTTATTGVDTDPDGYAVSIDNGPAQQIFDDATLTVPVDSGPHTVTLSGVAENCAPDGDNPRTVNVTVGGIVVVAFAIRCAEIAAPVLEGLLAFVSERDGNSEIYVVNADGTGLQRVTSENAADSDPAWSPDGSRLAFTSARGGQTSIYVRNADRSLVQRTAFPAYNPAWSPDGRMIAFHSVVDGSSKIQIMSADEDGSSPAVITDQGGYNYDGNPAANLDAAWSPDGRMIAFVSDWEPGYSAAGSVLHSIYVVNADGTGVPTGLTNTSCAGCWDYGYDWPLLDYFLHPSWSPDGSRIAFVHGKIINSSNSLPDVRYNVAVMNADGSDQRDLAWSGDLPWTALLDAGSLSWSPDGSSIAFTFIDCDLGPQGSCPNTRSIKYVRVADGQQGVIVSNGHDPSWRR